MADDEEERKRALFAKWRATVDFTPVIPSDLEMAVTTARVWTLLAEFEPKRFDKRSLPYKRAQLRMRNRIIQQQIPKVLRYIEIRISEVGEDHVPFPKDFQYAIYFHEPNPLDKGIGFSYSNFRTSLRAAVDAVSYTYELYRDIQPESSTATAHDFGPRQALAHMAVKAIRIGQLFEGEKPDYRTAYAYLESSQRVRYCDSVNQIAALQNVQTDMSADDIKSAIDKRYSILQAYHTTLDIEASVFHLMAEDARTMAAALTHAHVRGWAGELPNTLQPSTQWFALSDKIIEEHYPNIYVFRLVAGGDAWHRHMPLLARAMKYGIVYQERLGLTNENCTVFLSQYIRWFGRIATPKDWEGSIKIHMPSADKDRHDGFLDHWVTVLASLADPAKDEKIPFRRAHIFKVADFAQIIQTQPIATANVEDRPMSFTDALGTSFLSGQFDSGVGKQFFIIQPTFTQEYDRYVNDFLAQHPQIRTPPLRPSVFCPSLAPQTVVKSQWHNWRIQMYNHVILRWCTGSEISYNAIFAVSAQSMLEALRNPMRGPEFDAWFWHLVRILENDERRNQIFAVTDENCAQRSAHVQMINRLRTTRGPPPSALVVPDLGAANSIE